MVEGPDFAARMRDGAARAAELLWVFEAPRSPLWGVPVADRGPDGAPFLWDGDQA